MSYLVDAACKRCRRIAWKLILDADDVVHPHSLRLTAIECLGCGATFECTDALLYMSRERDHEDAGGLLSGNS